MYILLYFVLYQFLTGPVSPSQDVLKNKLHFGYGVNYKYNGQLYHNLDRVWAVHRVTLPKASELEELPVFPENLDCYINLREHEIAGSQGNLNRKQLIRQLCEQTLPNFQLLRKQADYYRHMAISLIKDELYHALHNLSPVSVIKYHTKKRSLPRLRTLLDNVTESNPHLTTGHRGKRFLAAAGAAFLPAIGKLATLAIEELGGYLQRKRNKALQTALHKLDTTVHMTRNMMHQLEKDFLMYGEYDINSTDNILNMFKGLNDRTNTLELWLSGHSSIMARNYLATANGPAMFSHQLQLYLNSLKEKYVRLHENLVTELRLLLRSIAILSKGYLPPQLFPPSTLSSLSQQAITMIKKQHPDYVLALPHITDYYDMRLVTFAMDEDGRLVIAFPIFVKDYKKEAMTLYQIETVKVPILDKNDKAQSYSEMSISKPYIASNRAYYIQLVLPELVMCKNIRHTYYCEELFLVKHKTKHSCESAIFYNLPRDTILQNCDFKYFHNITVQPSVLDGGSHLVLANMLNEKRLICSYDQGLAKPLPTSPYALVNRNILCHCHLQIGLTYLLKSIAACNASEIPVLQYTTNLAFLDYFSTFWENSTVTLPQVPTSNETVFPVSLEDYSQDPAFPIYGGERNPIPDTLKQLSQLQYQKKLFLESRKKLFSENQAEEMAPKLPDSGLKPKSGKSSFLFTVMFHVYIFVGSSIGIILILPYIIHAVKHRKLKTLVTAMTMYRAGTGEAAPVPNLTAPLTAIDIPTHPASKLVCHDPWVSFLLATITIIGLLLYFYRTCKHLTLVKGHKFASICHIYIIVGNATRYVPIKIGQHVGSPFLFKHNGVIHRDRLSLQKQVLWDHLHLDWTEEEVVYKGKKIPLRQHVTITLADKIRMRNILTPDCCLMYMVKQGDTWYQLSKLEY